MAADLRAASLADLAHLLQEISEELRERDCPVALAVAARNAGDELTHYIHTARQKTGLRKA